MFKEIKRKITLFNTLTLVAFLCVFIVIIGFFVSWLFRYSGEVYLKNAADEIIVRERFDNVDTNLKKLDDDGKNLRDNVGYDQLIWNEDHTVFKKKVDNDNLVIAGHELELDKHNLNRFITLTVRGYNYRCYSTTYVKDDTTYTLQVFQNINTEKLLMRYLITFLIGVGLVGILILIPISYFLAGVSVKPIKETFDQQKEFIADASHELRTPLTVIQTNVEVLRMKEDEVLSDNIRWLNNIQSESETMAGLIKELLLIAQADHKKIDIQRENFDISALCAEVVDLMFDVAKDHDILLKGAIPKGIEYYGDDDKLKQAIRILVDNAIKYTPGGGAVTLTLLDTGKNVIVAVQDTGVGLSEADQKKIFSRFYRVDNARHRESGGVGLGLNIADMVVKEHGGKIEIDSELNKGSTFSIVLPRSGHAPGKGNSKNKPTEN